MSAIAQSTESQKKIMSVLQLNSPFEPNHANEQNIYPNGDEMPPRYTPKGSNRHEGLCNLLLRACSQYRKHSNHFQAIGWV